ncbi:MAG: hypothetical protein KY469_21135 [Actinobacteria bacterium]|nr:hypothetical protein [Actinomycetota bacterium]
MRWYLRTVMVVLLVVAVALPAGAYPAPGRTHRLVPSGLEPDRPPAAEAAALSADGRLVAFTSRASDLWPGDDNDLFDVFVLDRERGVVELVSATPDGQPAGAFAELDLTPDGRVVAYASWSDEIVPGDVNDTFDVFVHDRDSGDTELISVATDGTPGDWGSDYPAMTPDGRYVAFASSATTLVNDDGNGTTSDVFVRDRVAGTTELVSVSNEGVQGNGASITPAISADGRFVAFESAATNLVADDTNGTVDVRLGRDIFVHDRHEGTTRRVSVASDGTGSNSWSQFADISADGRYVVFRSWGTNLVPQDQNASLDVFVHDLELGTTQRVSVSSQGEEGDGGTLANLPYARPAISPDGRFVAFANESTNLVADDANGAFDVYVHDRLLRTTELVSSSPEGGRPTEPVSRGAAGTASGSSSYPSVTADGRLVAFYSGAGDLVPDDANEQGDLFLRERGPALGVGGVTAGRADGSAHVEGWARFAGEVAVAATDRDDDAGIPARAAGAELTGASVLLRPEEEDVLVRIDVADLPGIRSPEEWGYPTFGGFVLCPGCYPPGVAGAPAVVYGLELEAAGARYEVRATRLPDEPTTEAAFSLHRCDPSCERIASLRGGYGTTGDEVLIAVPRELLPGSELTGAVVFAAGGAPDTGVFTRLDEIALGEFALPDPHVDLALAEAGTRVGDVDFNAEADLQEGWFVADLSADPSATDVWVRACLVTCAPPVHRPMPAG